jgi:hypothetical protein
MAALFAAFVMALIVLKLQLAQAHDGNKLQIGFSLEDMKGERWQTDLNSFEVRAKQLGAEVISGDAGGDADRQFQQVQDMIKAGIKDGGRPAALGLTISGSGLVFLDSNGQPRASLGITQGASLLALLDSKGNLLRQLP